MTLKEITEKLINFGHLFQLPEPRAEYVEAIHKEITERHWDEKQLTDALDYLKGDLEYNRMSRYNKYPTICDLLRADYDMRCI